MPPSTEKADAAKVVGESKSKPASKGKSGESPFVGRTLSITVARGPDVLKFDEMDCLEESGDFLHLRNVEGHRMWLNRKSILFFEDCADDDTDPAGVDTADMLANLAAFKANPGPLEDTGT